MNPKTPWHLWLIGVLALAWNSIGAYDYTMTETRNAAYMSAFTPDQLAYFYGLPSWVIATWALGVWGGVLGAVLLLFRQRLAVPVFWVSLIGMLTTFLHNYVLTNGAQIMGGSEVLVFAAVIAVVGILLLAYASYSQQKGILH